MDGASGILDLDKLWKPPQNRDFVPCVDPGANYTSPAESQGYLLVHTNGGLNQMRAGAGGKEKGACNTTATAPSLSSLFGNQMEHYVIEGEEIS